MQYAIAQVIWFWFNCISTSEILYIFRDYVHKLMNWKIMYKWKEKFSKPLEIIVPGKLERGLKHKLIFSLKIDLFQGFFHIFLEFLILSIFKTILDFRY